MYLSKGHMLYTAVMAGFQLILGLPMAGMILLMGLVDFSYIAGDLPDFIPFLLEFGFIGWLGVMNVRRFVHASKFSRMFTDCGCAAMTVAQAASKLQISELECQKRFDHLSRMGLLKHCHYECEKESRFVLHKKRTDDFRGVFIIILQMIAFFGIGLSGFMLFIMVFGLLNELFDGGLLYMDDLGVILFITLLFAAMMAGCLKIRKVIGLAYRFSNYLSGNAGRIVPAAQPARAFAKDEGTVVADFTKLKRWGLLTGWSLGNALPPQFIPYRMAQPAPKAPAKPQYPQPAPKPSAAKQYDAVNCPNCGASLMLEVGKVEQCPYCDSWLEV